MVLTTNDQILQWLDDHHGFANAYLTYTFDSNASELILDIEQRDKISLAGEMERIEVFSVVISDVEILSGKFEPTEGLSLFGIHSLDHSRGLIFDTWGKDEISFTCSQIFIKETREIERIAKPILSANNLVFKIRIDERPDADYWIRKSQKAGFEATYIGYFGNEIPTNEITDYTGLSIRPKEKENCLPLGVRFCKVVHSHGVLEVVIELQNSELQGFWQAFIRSLGGMDLIEVRSGNVVFAANEWIDFLDTATLPKRLL